MPFHMHSIQLILAANQTLSQIMYNCAMILTLTYPGRCQGARAPPQLWQTTVMYVADSQTAQPQHPS